MKKIVLKDNFAFIYLNKNFYTKANILTTLELYKEFFKASLTELGNYTTVKIENTNKDHTLKTLANEFSNYLIAQEYENKWAMTN